VPHRTRDASRACRSMTGFAMLTLEYRLAVRSA
jgi:hypothetical protein